MFWKNVDKVISTTLSKFYPDCILILSSFYPDFILKDMDGPESDRQKDLEKCVLIVLNTNQSSIQFLRP